jgi:hypothetical protein
MTDKLAELHERRKFFLDCLRTVTQLPQDDPQRMEAVEEYNIQLAAIDKQIEEMTGKPPAITIGLKPGVLNAKPQKQG